MTDEILEIYAGRGTLAYFGESVSTAEIARFEMERYYKEAVRIRYWDDQGKVAGLVTPQLETYRPLLESIAGDVHHAGGRA